MKFQCPCCGYFTYEAPAESSRGYICPVCFWECDPRTADDEPSAPNHGLTLAAARENFIEFGACEEAMIDNVRPPLDDELSEQRQSENVEKFFSDDD